MAKAKRRKQLDPGYGEVRNQWKGQNTVRGIKVDASAVKAYFEDPELLDWIKEVWEGDSFGGDGVYTASAFLSLLQKEIMKPDGFKHDTNCQVFTAQWGKVEIGGMNMESGVLWVTRPSMMSLRKPKLIIVSYHVPDWRKSLLDFVLKPHHTTISEIL